jgi:type IV secretory pathway TraG/TraD family ATPase VirD4
VAAKTGAKRSRTDGSRRRRLYRSVRQVYFKQKTFQEARDLSEAIGRTTIEDATVSDSGRVQEFIQGRHLITPDELISLNKEVIVFTADTAPLRLPLTEPLAYEQALSYDPPIREKHQVSDFVKRRGRTEQEQRADRESNAKPKPQYQQGKRPQQQSKPDLGMLKQSFLSS